MILSGLKATFSSLSNTAFVVAVSLYLLAVGVHFASLAWNSKLLRSVALVVTSIGATSHLAALATRAMAAGRPPWGNMYEFSMASSFVMVAAYLAVAKRFEAAYIGGFVLSGVAVWMGVGWVLYAEPGPLQPALRSNWLLFHVFLVMSGAGILLLASVVSVLYLIRLGWENKHGLHQTEPLMIDHEIPEHVLDSEKIREARLGRGELEEVLAETGGSSVRREGPGARTATAAGRVAPLSTGESRATGIVARLPSSSKLDQLAYRLVMVAFPIWTLGVIAGAIWGEQAWGRYWGWDPKEVWSFIVWMIFATYLHARATRGWRGQGAAVLAIVGGAAIIFNTFAVNLWIAGLHSYAGV